MRFRWHRADTDLERELAHHLHHLAADYERQGHSHEEALRMAKREFGGSEQVKEQCRDERRWAWRTGLWQDVVFGARMMRRTPVITFAAVLSLALGIGANTAIVSLMDVVLWRDLPVPNPRQLTLVHWQNQGSGIPRELIDGASGSMWREEGWNVADFFSYPSFRALREGLSGRASLAAFGDPGTVSVSFAGRATVGQERPVSGNFFPTLQIRAQLGRLFSDGDDNDAALATVVLSHRFWVRALGSDPSVIGKTIDVNNKPQVIAGVLEPSFYGLLPGDGTEIYAPLHAAWQEMPEGKRAWNSNRFWGVQLIARRGHQVSDTQLQPVMATLFRTSWSRQPKNAATRTADSSGRRRPRAGLPTK